MTSLVTQTNRKTDKQTKNMLSVEVHSTRRFKNK